MLEKTDRQQLLELQHGKPIKQFLEEAFEKPQGERHSLAAATLDLELAAVTFRNWAEQFGVDLKKRYEAENGAGETGDADGDSREPGAE